MASGSHMASIEVNGRTFDENNPEIHEKIKIIHNQESAKISIKILENSESILYWGEKKNTIDVQKYEINIEKELRKSGDGNQQIIVTVTNNSQAPRSRFTVQPRRSLKEDGTLETEEECKNRIREENERTEIAQSWNPYLFNIENERWFIHGSVFGSILEFEAREENINSAILPYSDPNDLEFVTNVVYDDSALTGHNGRFVGTIAYRDYLAFKERIPPMRIGEPVESFFSKLNLSNILAGALKKQGIDNLYKFQEDSLRAVVEASKNDKDSAVLISSRTAGGKTEAFILPIINYCIESKEKVPEEVGTKAIIFYPTKALANDQASRIIKHLHLVNKQLEKKIKVGLLHGDISTGNIDVSEMEGIPFVCPECEEGYLVPQSNTSVSCNNAKCGVSLDWVIALTREPIYGLTPDIIITNPDLLTFDMMTRPHHHGIFGRTIKTCTKCFMPSSLLNKRKCKCGNTILKLINPSVPKFIVFDEIHMFNGTFGINTSLFLSRLQALIRKYADLYHKDKSHTFTSIGSSATISNGKEFCEIFFNLRESIHIIPKDDEARKSYYDEKSTKETHRYHLFVMPYSYRPAASVAKIVGYLQNRKIFGEPPSPFERRRETTDSPLQILGFVNALGDSSTLIDASRRELIETMRFIKVGGHTTDFGKEQRARAEKGFNKQELHVIFATPTLEVGVDFRRIDCVLIYGFPFSFKDYVQRIGRGGRKENTLVITVCQQWKPIDHFYHSDAKRKITEQHNSLEPIPITRNNQDAISKNLRAAIFDIISSWDDSENVMEDLRLLEPDLSAQKESLISESLKNLALTDEQQEMSRPAAKEMVESILQKAGAVKSTDIKSSLIQKFKETNGYNDKYRLSDLRSTDSQVYVDVIWEASR
jgi:superfamily II DNA/RNA helicase